MDRDSETTELTADEVIDYLGRNPNFFDQHPDALTELKISHVGDGAVSLVERQLSVLRERNAELRRRYDLLVRRAEQNEVLLSATQEVISAIAAHEDQTRIGTRFTELVKKHFEIELAAFHQISVDEETPASKTAAHLLGSKAASSGPLRAHEMKSLFSTESGDGSAALARLTTKAGQSVVIAVGSTDATRYGIDDGTLFLEYLANVIANLITQVTIE